MSITAPWKSDKKRFPVPRKDYIAGTWAYAYGKDAREHPRYKEANRLAERHAKKNKIPSWVWWIRNWSDVEAVLDGCFFDVESGYSAVDFCQYCCHYEGELAGEPFEPADWQVYDIFMPIFGWKRPNPEYKPSVARSMKYIRRFTSAYIEIPKKNGKALALDTPIPTPYGWKKMGDMSEGDWIYGADGNQYRVIGISEIMEGHDCYRVTFSDGTSIVADADHLWQTQFRKPYKDKRLSFNVKVRTVGESGSSSYEYEGVNTTRQIGETINGYCGKNHRISLTKPIQCEDATLSISPYVLGVWLGDGHSNSPRITCGDKDVELLAHIESCGVSVTTKSQSAGNCAIYTIGKAGRWSVGMRTKLRDMNLLGNKHIPSRYMRGSESQRLELLRGLMDTDGFISKAGQCEFTTKSQKLRDGVLELCRTLGLKPVSSTKRATLNGKDYGEAYRVLFHPKPGQIVFKLSRKITRQRMTPKRDNEARSESRQIVSVEQCDSVPVKCIAVDSPDNLYLAGDGMISTHNTFMCSVIAIILLDFDGEPGAKVFSGAVDSDQSSLVYDAMSAMVRQSPDLSDHLDCIDYTRRVICRKTNSFYKALSSKVGSKEGKNIHGMIFDELHVYRDRGMWSTMKFGGAIRQQPIRISITTSGLYDPTSLGWEQHELAIRIRDAVGGAEKLWTNFAYVCGLSKDEEKDWTNPELHKKANPNWGVSIRPSEMEKSCLDAQESLASQNEFMRYRLDVWTQQVNAWMNMQLWDSRAAEYGESDMLGLTCYGGLDCSLSEDITGFALWFPPQGNIEKHRVLTWAFCPEEAIQRFDIEYNGMYSLWVKEGYLIATPGPTIKQDYIRKVINECGQKFAIRTIAYDKAFAENLAMQLSGEDGFDVGSFGQGAAAMHEPVTKLMDLTKNGEFEHPANPVLDWHMSNCQAIKDGGDRVRLVKNWGQQGKAQVRFKIDTVHAAVMALGTSLLDEYPIDMGYEVMWI